MRRELAFVYAVTLAGMAAPALLLLVLVRLLDPGAYGRLAAVQGMAVFLGVFADFGLFYSGSAAVARVRGHPERLGAVVTAGLLLRVLASTAAALLAYALLAGHPLLSQNRVLPPLGALLTLAYGLSPAWLYWGLDRQKGLALAEHGPRILLLLLVLAAAALAPLSPAHVLLLQTLAVAGVYAALWVRVMPGLALRRPRAKTLLALARDSAQLFLYRLFAAGFSNLNPYLLGLAAPAEAVGSFAAAERVVRAGLSLTEPLLRYHLPKLKSRGKGARRRLHVELALLSSALFLFFVLPARPLLELLLGPRFAETGTLETVFVVLSLLLLLHPQGKARLLAGVFAAGATGRALAVEAAAFGAYALGALALYAGGWLAPLSLAGMLVAVEALILLLALLAERARRGRS